MPKSHEPDDHRITEPDAPAKPGAKFFLAVFQSAWSEGRLYRCYPDPGGVSFLYAGPVIQFLDPEVARGGKKGTKTRAADALKTGLTRFAVGAGVFGFLILAIGLRLVLRGKADAADAAGAGVMLAVMVPTVFFGMLFVTLRKIVRRVGELDAMTPDERVGEAIRDKKSFRVTADNTEGTLIGKDDAAGQQVKASGLLSFRHDPSGTWKLRLPTKKDVKAAARALRQVLGEKEVAVSVPIGKD